ncbi:MAG: hypothetical protein SRB1_02515 [Desulfobacteraceae bacterium Eth-SRB1]|nr:MAG: hypothetical protein SRB1_02515 [Desulfobacteraceae bacterium Eth-SRB1]
MVEWSEVEWSEVGGRRSEVGVCLRRIRVKQDGIMDALIQNMEQADHVGVLNGIMDALIQTMEYPDVPACQETGILVPMLQRGNAYHMVFYAGAWKRARADDK